MQIPVHKLFMLVRIVEVSECRTGAVASLCYFYLDDAERHLDTNNTESQRHQYGTPKLLLF